MFDICKGGSVGIEFNIKLTFGVAVWVWTLPLTYSCTNAVFPSFVCKVFLKNSSHSNSKTLIPFLCLKKVFKSLYLVQNKDVTKPT